VDRTLVYWSINSREIWLSKQEEEEGEVLWRSHYEGKGFYKNSQLLLNYTRPIPGITSLIPPDTLSRLEFSYKYQLMLDDINKKYFFIK
jgi:hypothetical protein